jgi:hypothetical protein
MFSELDVAMNQFRRKAVLMVFLLLGVSQALGATKSEEAHMISKVDFDSFFNTATLVFSVKLDAVDPTFPVDDMPEGANLWKLKGHVVDVFKGKLRERSGEDFESAVSIYQGPVLSRPVGFWVNVLPVKNDSWLILTTTESKSSSSVAEIFKTNQGRAIELSRVQKYLPSSKPKSE